MKSSIKSLLALLLILTPIYSAGQTFSEVTSLVGVEYGAVDWGDFDGDGDLDILLVGRAGTNTNKIAVARIYRQGGPEVGWTFDDINAGLIGVWGGDAAWGDYDNDGDLDIFITGLTTVTGSNRISKIYRNDGNGIFTDINALLPGIKDGSVDWGDYDNDGDLDILLAGATDDGNIIANIYRNNGNDAFSFVDAGLPGIWLGEGEWGDYDNDGDLDIILSGDKGQAPLSLSATIFRNDDGVFTDIEADIVGVYFSTTAWGDMDNDGDLDLLLAGDRGFSDTLTTNYVSIVYENDNGTFVDSNADLVGYTVGSGAWGDYDNDGDSDILLMGAASADSAISARVYENQNGAFVEDENPGLDGVLYGAVAWGDYENDNDLDLLVTGFDENQTRIAKLYRNNVNQPNSAPTTPDGLTATILGTSVTLSWNPSSDNESGSNGLTYNLRIGTFAGGSDIVSPVSGGDGFRQLAQPGNMGHGTSWTINNLDAETDYHWSLQAVDHSFTGSEFAANHTFRIQDARWTGAGDGTSWSDAANWINNTPPGPVDRVFIDLNGDHTVNLDTDANIASLTIGGGSGTQTLVILGRTLTINGGLESRTNGVIDAAGGVLNTGTTITNKGRLLLDNSVISGTLDNQSTVLVTNEIGSTTTLVGRLQNAVADSLIIRATNASAIQFNITNNLTNEGVLILDNTSGSAQDVTLQALEIQNIASAAFTLLAATGGTRNLAGRLVNNGIFNIESGITATLQSAEAVHANDGTINLFADFDVSWSGESGTFENSGTITLNGSPTFSLTSGGFENAVSGVIQGQGTFDLDADAFINAGHLFPGQTSGDAAPGILAFDGNLAMQPTSTLHMEIGGTTAGTEFDRLVITGQTNFGGTMDVVLTDDFVPAQGNLFDIIQYGSHTDSLHALNGLLISQGLFFVPNFGGSALQLAADEDLNPPAAPQDLKIAVGNERLHLIWPANTEYDVDQYKIYRGTTSGSLALFDSVTVDFVTWTDSNVVNQTEYFYQIKAQDLALNTSEFSNEVSAIPSEPVSLLGSDLADIAHGSLDWGDYDNDGDLDLLVAGESGLNSRITKIYNNTNGTFTDAGINLVGISYGEARWADIDNDDDLDLALIGNAGPAGRIAKVYLNENGNFTELDTEMVGGNEASLAWGDYDGDGDLDLVLTGKDQDFKPFAKLYQNLQPYSTGFAPDKNLDPIFYGDAAWQDYDQDGDLDLVLSGNDSTGAQSVHLYKNNEGHLIKVTSPFVGTQNGALVWGDFDNDGDADLLITGEDENDDDVAAIYQNLAGNFLRVDHNLNPLRFSAAAFGDLNNDGLLDAAMAGQDSDGNYVSPVYHQADTGFFQIPTAMGGLRGAALALGDLDNDGDLDLALAGENQGILNTGIYANNQVKTKNPPAAAENLSFTVVGASVILTWNESTTAQTEGVTYNVRIGKSSTGTDVVNPHADQNGKRTLANHGQSGTTRALRGLSAGTYYFSVQTIASNFQTSGFSTEISFVLESLPDDIAPSAPTGLSASAGTGIVSLSWPANGDPDVNRYQIFRGTTPNASTLIDSVSVLEDLTFLDEDVTHGQAYYYRLRAIDDSSNVSGFSNEVTATPFQITAPQTLSAATGDGFVGLSWTDSNGGVLSRVRIYRGSTSPATTLIDSIDAGTVEFQDATATAGVNYFYRTTAVDTAGNESVFSNETTGFNYPQNFTIDANRSFGENTTGYRLIGLPGDISLPAGTMFTGESGKDWALYYDSGAPDDYLVSYDGSSIFNMTPGKGFWAWSKTRWVVSRETEAVNLSQTDSYTIALHGGWNIISNPYDIAISWADIQAENGFTDPLWGFNGSFAQSGILAPYEGFYFYNRNSLTTLNVPFKNASAAKTNAENLNQLAASHKSEHLQLFEVTFSQNGRNISRVYLGVNSRASNQLDRFDQFAPRADFVTESMVILSNEGQNLSTEIQSDKSAGRIFKIHFKSLAGQNYQLNFDNLDQFESEIYLVHPTTSAFINLHEINAIDFDRLPAETSIQIAVGSQDYIDQLKENSVPATYNLAPNYPNPFNPQTVIPYDLPAEHDGALVTLEIYDILGRKVATLVNKQQSAGRFNIIWNAQNSAGISVGSGVYFYRISAGDFVKTRKMVLIR